MWTDPRFESWRRKWEEKYGFHYNAQSYVSKEVKANYEAIPQKYSPAEVTKVLNRIRRVQKDDFSHLQEGRTLDNLSSSPGGLLLQFPELLNSTDDSDIKKILREKGVID